MRRAIAAGIVLGGCVLPSPLVREPAAVASPAPSAAIAIAVEDAPRPERCEDCHEAEAAEHAASMHAGAFDDPLFQREWGAGSGDGSVRSGWCVGCHAPLARDASDPRVHDGVGCASCHVQRGVIESVRASGRAPHATRVVTEQALGTERCAPCHELDAPSRSGHPEALQRTVSEWRSGGAPGTCAGCHMPLRGERAGRSHDVLGGRDEALTAGALEVSVTARVEGRSTVIDARLVTRAGHAVPTGDLYRRVVLTVSGSRGGSAEAELSRLFERDEDGERREVADQRVLPTAERLVRLALPAREREIDWTLSWHALPEDAPHTESIPRSLREQTWASGHVRVAE